APQPAAPPRGRTRRGRLHQPDGRGRQRPVRRGPHPRRARADHPGPRAADHLAADLRRLHLGDRAADPGRRGRRPAAGVRLRQDPGAAGLPVAVDQGDRRLPGPGPAGRPAEADRLAGGQPGRAGRLRGGRRDRAGADPAHGPAAPVRRGRVRPARGGAVRAGRLHPGPAEGAGDRARPGRADRRGVPGAGPGGPGDRAGLRQPVRRGPAALQHRGDRAGPGPGPPGRRRPEADLPRLLVRDPARLGVRPAVPEAGAGAGAGRRGRPAGRRGGGRADPGGRLREGVRPVRGGVPDPAGGLPDRAGPARHGHAGAGPGPAGADPGGPRPHGHRRARAARGGLRAVRPGHLAGAGVGDRGGRGRHLQRRAEPGRRLLPAWRERRVQQPARREHRGELRGHQGEGVRADGEEDPGGVADEVPDVRLDAGPRAAVLPAVGGAAAAGSRGPGGRRAAAAGDRHGQRPGDPVRVGAGAGPDAGLGAAADLARRGAHRVPEDAVRDRRGQHVPDLGQAARRRRLLRRLRL
ncbi:MAG: probable exported protease, partial [uncultured Corynebacteriales bacterium]